MFMILMILSMFLSGGAVIFAYRDKITKGYSMCKLGYSAYHKISKLAPGGKLTSDMMEKVLLAAINALTATEPTDADPYLNKLTLLNNAYIYKFEDSSGNIKTLTVPRICPSQDMAVIGASINGVTRRDRRDRRTRRTQGNHEMETEEIDLTPPGKASFSLSPDNLGLERIDVISGTGEVTSYSGKQKVVWPPEEEIGFDE